MKVAALDIGDVWTGIALSDALRITGRPYQTVHTPELESELEKLFQEERVSIVVVGHPKTMKGSKSAQTIKTEEARDRLEKRFPDQQWVLWDERMTSKQADQLIRPKTKEAKLSAHAVAAALILKSYLDYLSLNIEL